MTSSDVKIVADNLDEFIEVPNGIARLRNAMIALAVSGKLVPQDKNGGTMEKTYAEYRTRIVEQPHQRKIKSLLPLDSKSAPHAIPQSWCWARLTHLVDQGIIELTRGNVISKNDIANLPGIYPIYSSSKLNNGEFGRYGKFMFDEELITWSVDGGGYLFYRPKHNFSVTNVSGILRILEPELLDYKYLYLVLTYEHSKQKFDYANKAHPSDIRYLYNIPIPPLAEQKRIVEKVEEVMRQLDELETKKKQRDEVRTRLARSAMQALGNRESKIAFEHLAELVKTPTDLKELEGALLTLAVSGKLVPQDKKDGTAEELHAQIQVERAKKIGGRKRKEFAPVTPEEIPFEIPKSWKWVRISELVKLITDGEHISPEKHAKGIPLVTAKNVLESGITFENVDYVTKEDAKKFWNRCHPQKGDLLICSRGTIGRTSIVDIDEPFCLMGSVILIKFYEDTLSNYCKYYLRTQSGVAQIGLLRKGMAVGALYLKDIEKALIPLPPLAEQKRIIKRIEEVGALLQQLKSIL